MSSMHKKLDAERLIALANDQAEHRVLHSECATFEPHERCSECAPVQARAEPVAVVAEVHMSRYTIEWTNGPLPEGTQLYRAPQPAQVQASAPHPAPANAQMRDVLRALLDEIDDLTGESQGVYGLHLNGDPSPWEELLPGGRFERLSSLDEARAALAASQPAQPERQPLTRAASDVLAERRRQVEVEGWTPQHDDAEHLPDELAMAASCYATAEENDAPPAVWPWSWKWWKPKDRRRNLVKAGALILAELERLDRAHGTGQEGGAA